MPEVCKVLYERRYILVVIEGGITTSDVKVNDTHIHRPLKQHYLDEEAELMIRKLNENKNKVPTPIRRCYPHDYSAVNWQNRVSPKIFKIDIFAKYASIWVY